MNSLVFDIAKNEDMPEITAIYEHLKGTPGCTWHDEYPTWDILSSDINSGSLYVLRDKGAIIAAASVRGDDDLASEAGWESKNPCVLTRMGVARDYQGKGVGSFMLKKLIDAALARGYGGIVLIVNKYYPSGIALYERNGFVRRGEASLPEYGLNYYKYELVFEENNLTFAE